MLDLDKYFTIESLQRDKGESANKECNHSLETTCGKTSGSAISLSVKLRENSSHELSSPSRILCNCHLD